MSYAVRDFGPLVGRDRDRFESKYMPEPNTGCFLWTSTLSGKAPWLYGVMRVGKYPHILAHRLAYRLYCGPIPDGVLVLHRCDVPSCVNPAHLFLGSQLDNARDMVAKGRSARGTRNKRSKLSFDIAEKIRADQRKTGKIAKSYGVGNATVRDIKDGLRWIR